jgi:CRISPR/Cas system-associated exonuclease Cas4 (RecB family)
MGYKKNYISASELSDFVFCKRGWWLKFHNLLPKDAKKIQAMEEGAHEHNTLSRMAISYPMVIQAAAICFVMILIILYLLFS